MKPAQHATTNTFLRAPAGMSSCVDLPITRTRVPDPELPGAGDNVVISFWRPSEEELKALNEGRLLQLTCWAPTHPPIWVSVDGVASE